LRSYINDKLANIGTNTFNLEDEINNRSICNFTVIDEDNNFNFEKGMPIKMIDEDIIIGDLLTQSVDLNRTLDLSYTFDLNDSFEKFIDYLFGVDALSIFQSVYQGYVETSTKIPITNQSNYIHDIECADMHYLADKRRISYSAQNKLAGDIVKDLVDLKLYEEGVYYNIDSIEDGQEIVETRANFVPVTQVLDSLAEKTGFWWKITEDKELKFKNYESEQSDFNASPSIMRNPKVQYGNPLYRNQQIVKGPIGITELQTDSFQGDGETRSFTVGFSISKEPAIYVDRGSGFVLETVGKKSINADSQWYWEVEDATVTQERSETVLSPTDILKVEFIGQYKIVAQTKNPQEIYRQSQLDGTSGIIEDAINVQGVEGNAAAIAEGNAKLQEFAKKSTKLNYETRQSGLKAGQFQEVYGLSELNIIDGERLLITKVNTYDNNGIIFYQVEAVKGPRYHSWSEFFKELSMRAEIFVREGIGESEILVIPIDFTKNWTETEHPNIFTEVYPSETLYPSEDLYPMFDAEDRVKGIVWFNNTTELGRQELTQQTGETTANIETLTYLGPNSANESITHFGWYGGFNGTESMGTGVIVDKQAYSFTKTQQDSLQITKYDYKWD